MDRGVKNISNIKLLSVLFTIVAISFFFDRTDFCNIVNSCQCDSVGFRTSVTVNVHDELAKISALV